MTGRIRLTPETKKRLIEKGIIVNTKPEITEDDLMPDDQRTDEPNLLPEKIEIKTGDEIAAARRTLCRRSAYAILYAMTETDSSFEYLAERTGRSVDSIRRNFMKLASGDGGAMGFEFLSDILLAMGCEPRFELKKN
jgi:hypothetical protein